VVLGRVLAMPFDRVELVELALRPIMHVDHVLFEIEQSRRNRVSVNLNKNNKRLFNWLLTQCRKHYHEI
jgi:hypothetical protein